MSKVTYQIHCDACGFHRFTDGSDVKLVEIPRSHVQKKVPILSNGKIISPKPIQQSKMFKCPQCGRGIVAKTSKTKSLTHLENDKDAKNKD